MHRKWLVGGMALSIAGLILASGGQIAGAERSPAKAVKAIVVRSWSGCGSGEVVWGSLNDDWPLYGDVQFTNASGVVLSMDTFVVNVVRDITHD